jgi:hypothetical protein
VLWLKATRFAFKKIKLLLFLFIKSLNFLNANLLAFWREKLRFFCSEFGTEEKIQIAISTGSLVTMLIP